MAATDLPAPATRSGRGGRIGRALADLTPSGRAAVPASWALYDFANTIYSYAIVSYAIGLWAVDRLGDADGQFWVLVAGAASVLINAVVSPVLGAMSDRTGGRIRYLLVFTALTVIASALIGFVDVAAVGLILFAIANFGYQASLIYYDATLPLVARPEARGRVSGLGVAIGYLGTIVIALLILVLDSGASGLTFVLAAALFALFSVPLFLVVREPSRAATQRAFRLRDVAGSWQQLRASLDDARRVPGLLRFLVGRFFYTDPVNTVIVIMSVFAVKAIGLTASAANIVLLVLTVVAVIASFGWGQLVERIGPKRTLLVVLGTWVVGLLIVGSVLSFPTFLIGGALLGAGLGGVWTSDRVFMLRLSPPEQVGEFFGLYGIAGKFSAVTGPLLYGAIVSTLLNAGWGAGAYQVGIFSFLVLLVIGVVILRGVPEPPAEELGGGGDGGDGGDPTVLAPSAAERLVPAVAPIEPPHPGPPSADA
ncbi:MAG TPA: MFS transporter [Candidatus Limnocylindrales bacterium]|nr:MFS transporter [Candidatus Limnocylindrales bacterium]